MGMRELMKGLAHIGIPANDIGATIDFYVTLGFDLIMETVNEKADEKVAFLQMGNLCIETYENGQAALADGAVNHLAVEVSDIETVFTYLKEHQYELVTPEIEFLPFWEHGVKFCTIKGPNRENIEFCQKLN